MLVNNFKKLNQAVYEGKRAPHKPLLILLALSYYQNGHSRFINYKEVDEKLKKLLKEFGPTRKSYHPELPFFHLQNDGIWELSGDHEKSIAELNKMNKASKTFFLNKNISGGFKEEIFQKLNNSEIIEIVSFLLDSHFPESLHEDLLNEIGLTINTLKISRRRDPKFREEILRAYEYKCAVCGFQAILNGYYIGLDAAHIMWHQANGPDEINNGVTLCSMHHKLFDRGVFTIDENMRVIVSERVSGNKIYSEIMTKYHGNRISKPLRPSYYPEDNYLTWHASEVFHHPGRYI